LKNSRQDRSFGKCFFAILTVASILMTGIIAWQSQAQAFVDLPPTTLTIVALDGSQVVMNETDIGNLTSYRAFGGYKTSGGSLKGLGNYTGVPIKTFCDMVGGIISGYSVNIIAADGFSKLMSFEEMNGNLVTYDNVTGQELQHNDTLTPILAYHYNDANLSSTEGPLKSAIVGPEGLLTNSTFWVKQVVRLELHPNLQPMNLTIVALNGTELVLNEANVSNLPAVRGVGALRNQLGNVKNLGNYTGPSLNTFLDLVGGMNSDNSLRVTAIDNYTKTFSYAEVNDAFDTYDNITGQPVEHNQSLTPILAYYFNDVNVSLSDGPLRSAIIGPEGLATYSTYWVKQVIRLEIRYRDEVAVPMALPLKTVVGQNYTCSTNVTVQNIGGYNETFNLTLYANASTAATMLNLVMENGTEAVVSLTWNATGFGYGNYTVKATASTVPGETNTTDNTFISATQVHAGVPGDISSATLGVYDGTTNMRDIQYLILLFNTNPSSPNWKPNADINNDGVCNMRDIQIAILNFNQHE
jgi:hypothetical protein